VKYFPKRLARVHHVFARDLALNPKRALALRPDLPQHQLWWDGAASPDALFNLSLQGTRHPLKLVEKEFKTLWLQQPLQRGISCALEPSDVQAGADRLRACESFDVVQHEDLIFSTTSSAEEWELTEGGFGKRRRHLAYIESRRHLERDAARALRTVRDNKDNCVPREMIHLVRRSDQHTARLDLAKRHKNILCMLSAHFRMCPHVRTVSRF
jgi:hypothetical protein